MNNLQILAAIAAAAAFGVAFMTAEAPLTALLFALVGAGVLGWLVYRMSHQVLIRRLEIAPTPTSHARHQTVRSPSI